MEDKALEKSQIYNDEHLTIVRCVTNDVYNTYRHWLEATCKDCVLKFYGSHKRVGEEVSYRIPATVKIDDRLFVYFTSYYEGCLPTYKLFELKEME